ncbi:MAG: hypothetical protein RLZZ338_3092 [Cyanobacteriota bacterium]|jgi:pimeloyl-ACP methyl ester carboxylesterase
MINLLPRNSRVKLSIGKIYGREIGQDGPVLVFLHGSWYDSLQWLSVMKELAPNYHCFAPDLLGCGDSHSINVHYSIDLEVESLAEYLDTLKIKQFYFVAHSLGAWVATSYALKYRDRVLGLILLAPEGVTLAQQKNRWNLAKLLVTKPPVYLGLLKLLFPLAKIFNKQQEWQKQLAFRKTLLGSKTARKLLFERKNVEIKAELLDDRVSSLNVPTLILQPNDEDAIAHSLGETYAKLNPMIKLKSVMGGENLPQESPQVIAEAIRAFVPRRLLKLYR